MQTTFTLSLSLEELAEFTASLYRQGINFTVKQYGDEYTFTYTGY